MTATELSPAPTELAAPDYIARAREVAKVIEAEANNIEEAATITRPVYEALADAGLFWILIPGAYGGGGTDIVTAFKVIQEISAPTVPPAGHSWPTSAARPSPPAFMNSEGGQEMFGGGEQGDHRRHGGAHRQGDPRRRRLPGGQPVPVRQRLGPRELDRRRIRRRSDDNGEPFSSTANRSAGSRSCLATRSSSSGTGMSWAWSAPAPRLRGQDRFVPDKFTMETFATVPTQAEPVYQLGLLGIGVGGHAPVALGLAQRALQEIAGIVNNKIRPGYDGPVGDSDLFQLDFMRHEAKFRAAQAYVYEVFGDAEATAAQGIEISDEQRAGCGRPPPGCRR